MTRNIFIDLDGTLLDPRQRLYNLFCELLPGNSLSFDAYWKIKRQRASQKEVLKKHSSLSESEIDEFHRMWMMKIEEPARLELDKPLEGAGDFLDRASRAHALYLVTARQYPERVHAQISRAGWNRYFKEIFVTAGKRTKAELIRESVKCVPEDFFIGDTGEDIKSGKELGIATIAVTSGILAKNILQEYEPDHIVGSVADLEVPFLGRFL